jgi:hypothetical protein
MWNFGLAMKDYKLTKNKLELKVVKRFKFPKTIPVSLIELIF